MFLFCSFFYLKVFNHKMFLFCSFFYLKVFSLKMLFCFDFYKTFLPINGENYSFSLTFTCRAKGKPFCTSLWASDAIWKSNRRLYEVRTSYRRPLDVQRTFDADWDARRNFWCLIMTSCLFYFFFLNFPALKCS